MKKPTPAELEEREREERRIAHQRNAFTFLHPSAQVDALKRAMLQRAYDLLWEGNCEACDAITEFLPSRDVEEMLAAWLHDHTGGKPTSRWYDGVTT